jgi:hypothetical protein
MLNPSLRCQLNPYHPYNLFFFLHTENQVYKFGYFYSFLFPLTSGNWKPPKSIHNAFTTPRFCTSTKIWWEVLKNHLTRRPHNIKHFANVMEEHYLYLIVEDRVPRYALLIQKKDTFPTGFFQLFSILAIFKLSANFSKKCSQNCERGGVECLSFIITRSSDETWL